MKTIILILLFVLSFSAYAKDHESDKGSNGKNPVTKFKPTISITPELVPDYKVASGEKALFKGRICLLKQHPVKMDKPKCEELEEDEHFKKHTIKFFFPDTNTEVTENVSIIRDEQGITYSYESHEINPADENRLAVVITREEARLDKLMHIQAKIEKFIKLISAHEDHKEHKNKSKDLEALTKVLAKLKEKLQERLRDEPALLAKLSYPVQVNNLIAPPVEYASTVSGMRLWMQINQGSLISGEKAKIIAKISNMEEVEGKEDNEYDDHDYLDRKWRYRAQFYWMGNLLQETEEKRLTSGDMFEYGYITEGLSPLDVNQFGIKLLRSKEVPSHAASYKMLQNQGWGAINYSLPVITDTLVPVWSSESVITKMEYYQNYPLLKMNVSDAFGRVNADSLIATINGEALSGIQIEAQGQLLEIDNGSQGYDISKELNPLQEGVYEVSVAINDFAGNSAIPDPNIRQFRIDRTVPVFNVGLADSILTNNPNLSFNINVIDLSPVEVTVTHNGEKKTYAGYSNVINLILDEGMNSVEVFVVDAAGNAADIYINNNIELDTIPPEISNVFPSANQVVRQLKFDIKGNSNEPLSKVIIDGTEKNLDGSTTFSHTVIKGREGGHDLSINAYDLAGNVTNISHQYEILLKLIRIELVSLVQSEDGNIQVVGTEWAARPGQLIEISGGFFNNTSVTADDRGRFLAEIDYSTSITLEAEDHSLNRYEKYTLGYQADTTFSGIVKSSDDTPLPGVTVTILNSGQSAITDGSGIFSITNPALGIQAIKIDGKTISKEFLNDEKKYSALQINVNMSYKARNQLGRPIYLVPLMLDGSEIEILPDQDAVVESPHAPGVRLYIPANVADFGENYIPPSEDPVDSDGDGIPDGDVLEEEKFNRNVINVMTVPVDKTSIEVFAAARPETVYAFEPSGLRFKEPVQLELPNTNEFEVGTELVVMSKNSETGKWELDGAAVVRDSDTIETIEGSGITHFSEVYVAPYGMNISKYGDDSTKGIDTDTGILTRGVTLPSYKENGRDITPALVYKSKWAYPTALVANVFNTKKEVLRRIKHADERIDGGMWQQAEIKKTSEIWTKPQRVVSKFFIADKESGDIEFNLLDAPDEAVVSYHAILNDLGTGVYPAVSTYEIFYKNFVTTTIKSKSFGLLPTLGSMFHTPLSTKFLFSEGDSFTSQIGEETSVFAPNLIQVLYHQNKINSEFGTGWHFAATQKIINPNSSQLMVEEEDGGVSVFVLDNTIETLAYDSEGIKSANFLYDDRVEYVDSKGRVKEVDLLNNLSISHKANLGSYEFELGVNKAYKYSQKKKCTKKNWAGDCKQTRWFINVRCVRDRYAFTLNKDITSNFDYNGASYYLDKRGAISKLVNGHESVPVGFLDTPAYFDEANLDYDPDHQPHCKNISGGQECTNRTYDNTWTFTHKDPWRQWTPSQAHCGDVQVGSGVMPIEGDEVGGLSASRFSLPLGMTPSLTESDVIFVADTGNNKVKKINLATGHVSLFAGNNTTYEHTNIEGNYATNFAITMPRGVLTDSRGNVYITTHTGKVILVDKDRRARTIIGKTSSGAALAETTIEKLKLLNPTGMALNEVANKLYIADTGHNRIVEVDFTKNIAKQVAGNNHCYPGEDHVKNGSPALSVSICAPEQIGLDSVGNLRILDHRNKRIRKVTFGGMSIGAATYKSGDLPNQKITKNDDGTFVREYRNNSKAYFSKQGYQTSSKDALNNTTQFTYVDNKLEKIIGPTNLTSIFKYYPDGKLEYFEDPAKRRTTFYYDGDLLSNVEYSDGTGKSFAYDKSKGLLIGEKNERNYLTEFKYNIWDRLSQVIRPGEEPSNLKFGILATTPIPGDDTEMYVPNRSKTNENSDPLADVYRDAEGHDTTVFPDVNGHITEIKDAKGRITTIEKGEVEADPSNNIEYYKYVIVKKYDGYEVEIRTNSKGDVVYTYNTETGVKEEFSYDDLGNVVSKSSTAGGGFTRSYYSGTSLLKSETDANGVSSYRTYYPNGLLKTISNDINEATTFYYDVHGNLSKKVLPGLEKVVFHRDDAGNIVSKESDSLRTTAYSYDDFNRLISVEAGISSGNPVGDVTTYSYTPTGQLEKIIDPKLNTTTFEYDKVDRLSKKVTPSSQIVEMKYDGNDNVIWTNNSGVITNMWYDSDSLLTRKELPDNTYVLGYDLDGNLENISDNDSYLEFTYEKVAGDYQVSTAKASGVEMPSYQLNYQYYDNGQRKLMSTYWGDFAYKYDFGGRLYELVNHKNEVFTFGYDEANRLKRITRPSSVTHLSFDSNSFLTGISHSNSSDEVVNSFIYEKDNAGNRTKSITMHGSTSYTYDSNFQLKTASSSEIVGDYVDESFSYDSLGNRLNDQLGSYTYDAKAQRLMEDYQYIYSYDTRGNMTSRQEKGFTGNFTNYDYSSENQLIKIEVYQNNFLTKEVRYQYDALGRRMRKKITDHQNATNSFERKFLYDGQEILAELDENNNELAIFTHSTLRTDDVLAVDIKSTKLANSTGSYFYLKDALGSVIDIVNGSGSIVQHYAYSSFGKLLKISDASGNDVTAAPPVKTSYGFTNREHDEESGMMYYRARYYMPEIGRFITEDADAGRYSRPQTVFNRYVYVTNNPTKYADPKGEFGIIVGILIASAIGGALNMAITGKYTAEAFLTGFKAAAIASTIVVGGAFVGAWVATGSFSAAVAGGTTASILGATIGGAAAGGYWGYKTTGTIEGAILGAVGGAFTGAALGAYGFSLTPSKNNPENIVNGLNDANRGGTTNIVPQKCAPVPNSDGVYWKCE